MYTLTPRCCHLQPALRRRSPPPPCQAATTTTTTTTTTSPSPPPPPSLSSIPSRRAADRDDASLRSTWPHRAWTLAGTAAILSSLSTSASLAVSTTDSTSSAAEPLAAAVAAYALADLATGVYHWLVDNYGSASTPVLGPQIAAFQGHHRRPATITRREPCNNLHALARAAALVLPPLTAALSAASAPPAAHAFAGTFAACVVLSQQFHAWAHEKKRRRGLLPAGIQALQDAGVLVSRAQHAAHHRRPYCTNYCIVSGVWNGVLDRYRVFEALEMVVYFRTGVRPRSWDETDVSWTEEDAGGEEEAAGDGEDGGLLQTTAVGVDRV